MQLYLLYCGVDQRIETGANNINWTVFVIVEVICDVEDWIDRTEFFL